MMRNEYVHREDRRRFLSSLLGALIVYAVVGIGVVVLNFGAPRELPDLPSPVWIDFAEAENEATGSASGSLAAASAAPVATEAVVTPAPAAKLPAPAAKQASPAAPKAVAKSSPAPAKAAPAPTAAAEAAPPTESWTPGSRPAGSRITSVTSETSTAAGGQQAQASAASAMTTVVSGSEVGNSQEVVLGARAGKAGRSLYVPIYLYLPLPRQVDAAVVGKIPPEYREAFFRNYSRQGEGYALTANVPIAKRDDIWLALEKGGYDVAGADYKASGKLDPISLSFVVTSVSGSSQPRLEAVTITASSGNVAVDEAVVFGFGRASFFNATDGTISGTFTYRFSK